MDVCQQYRAVYTAWSTSTTLLIGSCVAGDDDDDETVPLKPKETKRFKDRQVVGMEIGGQILSSNFHPNDLPVVDKQRLQ